MSAAATIQDFGRIDFSSLIKLEGMKQNARRFGLILANPSAHFNYGVRGLKPVGIAESVKEIAFDSSSALSAQLRHRVGELANLKANWDGEGARPVKPHVLADAVETLKRLSLQTSVFREPFLAPTFDGFVQIEWHEEQRRLDLEAVEKGWSAVGTMVGSEDQRHYYTAEFERNDIAQLVKFYQWLLGDELIWPSL